MLLPHELSPSLLRDMEDTELLAHEDHYRTVLDTVQNALEHASTLHALAVAHGTTETAERCERELADRNEAVTRWLRATQMTCNEAKRRDEEQRRDAHRAHTLLEAAHYLEEETMYDAARTCRVLAGEEEATAGAGL